jgi:hypothetical protein
LTIIDTPKATPKVLPVQAQAPKPAPKPGAKKPAAAPKEKPRRGEWRWPDVAPDAEIVILVKDCPRQPGTKAADHWMKHVAGKKQTVAKFVASGGEVARLRTDIKRGSIRLEGGAP